MLQSLNVSFFVAAGISLCGTVIATFLKIFETDSNPAEIESETAGRSSEVC